LGKSPKQISDKRKGKPTRQQVDRWSNDENWEITKAGLLNQFWSEMLQNEPEFYLNMFTDIGRIRSRYFDLLEKADEKHEMIISTGEVLKAMEFQIEVLRIKVANDKQQESKEDKSSYLAWLETEDGLRVNKLQRESLRKFEEREKEVV